MRKKDQRLVINGTIIFIVLGLILYLIYNTGLFGTNQNSPSSAVLPTPTPITTSIVSFKKHPNENKLDVVLDSGAKPVSAAQLDISFDPNVLTNMQVTNGDFFDNPVVLMNKVTGGNIFYAAAIPAIGKDKAGQGVVAVLSYTPNAVAGNQTSLKFLSRTKITTTDLNNSILKQAQGITLSY